MNRAYPRYRGYPHFRPVAFSAMGKCSPAECKDAMPWDSCYYGCFWDKGVSLVKGAFTHVVEHNRSVLRTNPVDHTIDMAFKKPIEDMKDPNTWVMIASVVAGPYIQAAFGISNNSLTVINKVLAGVVSGQDPIEILKTLIGDNFWRVREFADQQYAQFLLDHPDLKIPDLVKLADEQALLLTDQIQRLITDPAIERAVKDAFDACKLPTPNPKDAKAIGELRQCLEAKGLTPEKLTADFCKATGLPCRPDAMAFALNVNLKAPLYTWGEFQIATGQRPAPSAPITNVDEAYFRYVESLRSLGPDNAATKKLKDIYRLFLESQWHDPRRPMTDRLRAEYRLIQLDAFPISIPDPIYPSGAWPPKFAAAIMDLNRRYDEASRAELRAQALANLFGKPPAENIDTIPSKTWASRLVAARLGKEQGQVSTDPLPIEDLQNRYHSALVRETQERVSADLNQAATNLKYGTGAKIMTGLVLTAPLWGVLLHHHFSRTRTGARR